MTTIHIAAGTSENLLTPIDVEGVDRETLETYAIHYALVEWDTGATPVPPEPEAGDWTAGSWVSTTDVPTGRIVVGTGGIAIVAGTTYGLWVRITGGSVAPVKLAATVVVGSGATYSGNPASSNRDAVRFRLQDIGPTRWWLTDAEVDYLLSSTADSILLAAAAGADTIAARFAAQADSETNGDQKIDLRDRAKRMRDLADRLRDLATTQAGAADLPAGLGFADDEQYDSVPWVWRGIMDNPEAPGYDRVTLG